MSIARIFGTPTINPALFAMGKLSLVVIVAAPLAQLAGLRLAAPVPGMTIPAAVLAAAGLLILAVALRELGSSLRVGLPAEETVLKTSGIYRFSRHPIYLAMFILCIAAVLYCPHPAVIAAAIVAAAIHHLIALGEERFLERRFGRAWTEHKARVPRYLGIPRRS